jgi:hypothetical protein
MWGSLLALGLLLSLHPLRLGVTLIVISRSRPMQNLFAYWLGSLTVCVLFLVIPLFLLHYIPALSSFTRVADPATSPTARHVGLGLGVLSLLVAALMLVRSKVRPRGRVSASGGRRRGGGADAGSVATQVLDDDRSNPNDQPDPRDQRNPIARLLGQDGDSDLDDKSRGRRLVGRIRNAWESGALWVSFVIGLAVGPSIDGVLVVLAIIVATGSAIGLQISAAATFIVAMLAVEEVILVSNVAAPTRTQAMLRRLHEWAQTHRRKVLIAIFAVVGVSLVIQGIASG